MQKYSALNIEIRHGTAQLTVMIDNQIRLDIVYLQKRLRTQRISGLLLRPRLQRRQDCLRRFPA